MKAKRYTDPALRAADSFDVARMLGDGVGVMFPVQRGRPVAMSTPPKILQHHGIAVVARGFRFSFQNWRPTRRTATRFVGAEGVTHD